MQRYGAKFFNGRSPTSSQVDVFVQDGFLHIVEGENTVGRWPLGSLFRDPAHSVATVIGCGMDDARLEVDDTALLKELKITPKVWSMAALKEVKWWIAVWIVVVAGTFAITIWNSRLISQFFAARISVETEAAIFSKLGIEEHWKICSLTQTQQQSLDKIVRRLTLEKEKPVTVKVAKIKEENAFSLPGGTVLILSELLHNMKTPEELAGVLGHEIEHVQRRHVMEALVRASLYTVLLNFSFGGLHGLFLIDPQTAAQIYNLRLSREMETEADQGAVHRLLAGHVSVNGAVTFFKRMNEKQKDPKYLDFLFTHPATLLRVQLYELADKIKTRPELLTKNEWSDLQQACP